MAPVRSHDGVVSEGGSGDGENGTDSRFIEEVE